MKTSFAKHCVTAILAFWFLPAQADDDEFDLSNKVIQKLRAEVAHHVRENIESAVDGISLLTNNDILSASYIKIQGDEDGDIRFSGLKIPVTWRWVVPETGGESALFQLYVARGEAKTEERLFDEDIRKNISTFTSHSLGVTFNYRYQMSPGTWLIPSLSASYQTIENRYDHRGKFSGQFRPVFDGFLSNWRLDAITINPKLTFAEAWRYEGYDLLFSASYGYSHVYTTNFDSDVHNIDFDRNLFTTMMTAATPLNIPISSNPVLAELSYSFSHLPDSRFTSSKHIDIHRLQLTMEFTTGLGIHDSFLEQVTLVIGAGLGSGRELEVFDIGLKSPF
ncbi:hypothetical protein [Veronia pacifica]|uniref:Solitary outer membrane autotransporter beta-barrel domain-containing protein n=1 Tax=Veronia pacifica TaxID=1080227 RepID=A0A1C3ELB3_9GAMM|nr:hypothetical protein [Veronia pacifica]ODA34033.1 hypothetical protein A8L45_08290 [Veronia pacifica]